MSVLIDKSLSRVVRRSAFSMVEAVISMLIVGMMLAAALHTVGASKVGATVIAENSKGLHLAQDLMTEILQLPYQEPNTEGALGRDIGEGTTSRAHYDDVDDYHQWNSSPPQYKNGTAILLTENYTRSVEVCWVHPSDLSQSIATATGVKRIDVKVSCNGTPAASLTAFRTSAWVMDLDGSGWSATPSNNPPTAVAIGDPLTGYPPLTVIFYAIGSEDADGDSLTYDWDFGDGNSSSGEVVNHTYMDPGTYNVTLTVSDGRGGVDTDTLTVMVKAMG